EGESVAASDPLIGGVPGIAEGTPLLLISDGCTAVKIGRRTFLTAAHCVMVNDPVAKRFYGIVDQDYQIGAPIAIAKSSSTPAANWYGSAILDTIIHPSMLNACSPSVGCTADDLEKAPFPSDVAVVFLKSDFPSYFGLSATVGSAAPGDWVYMT